MPHLHLTCLIRFFKYNEPNKTAIVNFAHASSDINWSGLIAPILQSWHNLKQNIHFVGNETKTAVAIVRLFASVTQSEQSPQKERSKNARNARDLIFRTVEVNFHKLRGGVRTTIIFTWLGVGRGWESARANWPSWAITGNHVTTDTDCPLAQMWAA